MEKAIAEAFLCEEAIRAAVQDRGARKTALYEVCDGQQAALAALLREQTGRPVIYITASSAKAARIRSRWSISMNCDKFFSLRFGMYKMSSMFRAKFTNDARTSFRASSSETFNAGIICATARSRCFLISR